METTPNLHELTHEKLRDLYLKLSEEIKILKKEVEKAKKKVSRKSNTIKTWQKKRDRTLAIPPCLLK